jgi:hypothetical protein
MKRVEAATSRPTTAPLAATDSFLINAKDGWRRRDLAHYAAAHPSYTEARSMIDLGKSHYIRVRALPNGKYSVKYLDPAHPAVWMLDCDRTLAELHDFCHQQWPGRFSKREIDEVAMRIPGVRN